MYACKYVCMYVYPLCNCMLFLIGLRHLCTCYCTTLYITIYAPQVVIERQPQKDQVIISDYTKETPNSYIVFSITCLVFTVLCGWPLLICTIPAMFLSILVSDSISLILVDTQLLHTGILLQSKARADKGDIEFANDYGRWAFGLNMTAVVGFAVLFLGVIIFEVVVNSTQLSEVMNSMQTHDITNIRLIKCTSF